MLVCDGNSVVAEPDCSRRAPGYFTLIGNEAPPTARNTDEVACKELRQRKLRAHVVFGQYSILVGRIAHLGRVNHYNGHFAPLLVW